MELITSFYDNSLVYYPNIFFAAILLSIILVGIYFVKVVRYLWAILHTVYKKMASRKYIKGRNKRVVVSLLHQSQEVVGSMWEVIYSISNSLARGLSHINSVLRQLELYIQKIGKKMRKEFFIESGRHE